MTLTASAPPHIETAVISLLELHDPAIVKLPLDRPNIYISVMRKVTLAVSVQKMVIN